MGAESNLLPVIRGCDGCTLCCKVMAVQALGKPRGTWCQHCTIGTGCGIYEQRPGECIEFNCGYLGLPHLTAEWKPAISHLIISSGVSKDRLSIHVDPARPDAWRRQPYYATMKQWARTALDRRQQVVVIVGNRSIVVMPDRDVDFGVVADDELIVIGESAVPGEAAHEPFVVKRDSDLGRAVGASGGAPRAVGPGQEDALRRGRVLP